MCPNLTYLTLDPYTLAVSCRCVGNTIYASPRTACYCPTSISTYSSLKGLCICKAGFYETTTNGVFNCIKAVCDSSCLKCMTNSNICEVCPLNAISTNNYT